MQASRVQIGHLLNHAVYAEISGTASTVFTSEDTQTPCRNASILQPCCAVFLVDCSAGDLRGAGRMLLADTCVAAAKAAISLELCVYVCVCVRGEGGRQRERAGVWCTLFDAPKVGRAAKLPCERQRRVFSHWFGYIATVMLLVCLLFPHSCLGGVVVSFLPLQNGRGRDSARARGTSL